jgi:hypothetical protein
MCEDGGVRGEVFFTARATLFFIFGKIIRLKARQRYITLHTDFPSFENLESLFSTLPHHATR